MAENNNNNQSSKTPAKKTRRRRKTRKTGKYTPLVWILTGSLIAFFISFSEEWSDTKWNQIVQKKKSEETVEEKQRKIFEKKENQKKKQLTEKEKPEVKKNQENSDRAEIKTVHLYLAQKNEQSVRIIPYEVTVEERSVKDALNAVIQYRGGDYLNLIPLNTGVLSVRIQDGFAHVDLSENFSYNSYGVLGYRVQIYQIVYTASQFDNVDAVYFYIEGKPLEYLGGEGIEIENPVYPFSSLPEFSY